MTIKMSLYFSYCFQQIGSDISITNRKQLALQSLWTHTWKYIGKFVHE